MNKLALLIAILTLALAGCGGSPGAVPVLSLTPSTASIVPNAQKQFTLDQDVIVDWSAPDGGTVVNGLFTAPNSTGTYRVVATSFLNPLASTTATVNVSNIGVSVIPSVISVAPSSVNTNALTAIVSGNPTRTVAWSIDQAGGGSIASGSNDVDGNGRATYTAGTSPGFFTVRATSAVDTSVSDTCQVRILGPSSLAVNPRSVTISATAPNNVVTVTAVLTDAAGAVDTTSALTWDVPLNPAGGSLSGSDPRQRTFTVPTSFFGVVTCQVRVRTSQNVIALATIQVVAG